MPPVQLNFNALRADRISIQLLGADSVEAVRRSVSERSPVDVSWSGNIPSTGGSATFVVKGAEATGTIQNGPDLYAVVPLGQNVQAILKIDRSRLPPDHAPSGQRGGNTNPVATATPTAAIEQIDVYVPYTAATKAAAPNIESMIQLAIDESNQAYVASGISVKLNLVGTKLIGYSEAGKQFRDVLVDMYQGADADMVQIRQDRDRLGADIVSLIVNIPAACGEAYDIGVDADHAFVAVYHQYPTGCLTGNYSLVHEIGHLFGARHDPQTDPTNAPFLYGHGFVHGTDWRTIMAYGSACGNCPRRQIFSNPPNYGAPNLNDVARVHRERAAVVAGFRTVVPPVVPRLARLAPVSGGVATEAYAISSGGDFIAGDSCGAPTVCSAEVPTLWKQGSPASLAATGYVSATAWGVSADGSVVAGAARATGLEVPVRWIFGQLSQLRDFDGSPGPGVVRSVSANGRTVVGYSGAGNGSQGVFWTNDSTTAVRLKSEDNSWAAGVSGDGSIIVGQHKKRSAMWTNAGQNRIDLPLLSDHTVGNALAISENGQVIVGYSTGANGVSVAVSWTNQRVQALEPALSYSMAWGVSKDGKVIVGSRGPNAFRWTSTSGMYDLYTLLRGANIDVTGWDIHDAFGVSADGTRIVGRGSRLLPQQVFTGFVVDLPVQ